MKLLMFIHFKLKKTDTVRKTDTVKVCVRNRYCESLNRSLQIKATGIIDIDYLNNLCLSLRIQQYFGCSFDKCYWKVS